MRTKSFTLIHGTFAAKSKWLNQSAEENPSNFRALLKNKFSGPIRFHIPRPWGGTSLRTMSRDLTNKARLDGAKAIQDHLRGLPHDQDNFLIAHSHGGNVAMYALKDEQVQHNTAGLICLATPFLYPKARPLSILAVALSLMIMVIGFIQLIVAMNLWERGWYAVGAALAGVIAIGVPTYLLVTITRTRYRSRAEENQSLAAHIESLSYDDPKVPILLIKASGDEASGLLRGIQFLNWLGGMAMYIGGKQLYALVCASALVAAWYFSKGQAWLISDAFTWLNMVLMVTACIMVLMLMGLTISRLSVGWDAWKWVGEIETMVEDGPPGTKASILVLPPRSPALGRLNHTTLFTQEETLAAIHQWCEKVSLDRCR